MNHGPDPVAGSAGCSKWRLAVLALATNRLNGCAPGGSEPVVMTACPPIVEYSREFQARAADELALVPEGSAIAAMLSDYAVMREHSLICQSADAVFIGTTPFLASPRSTYLAALPWRGSAHGDSSIGVT